MKELDEIQTESCASSIAKILAEISLWQVIAQLASTYTP